MGDDGIEHGWLGHNGDSRSGGQEAVWRSPLNPTAGEMVDPQAGRFFVDSEGENDIRSAAGGGLGQLQEGGNHGGHSPFDIAASSAEELIAGDIGPKGGDGHPLDRDSVLVGVEKDCNKMADIWEAADDVRAAGSDIVGFAFEAMAAKVIEEERGEPGLEKLGASDGPAHWVNAGDGDQVFQETHNIHVQFPCVEAVIGLGVIGDCAGWLALGFGQVSGLIRCSSFLKAELHDDRFNSGTE
jgi:hypothetical protein